MLCQKQQGKQQNHFYPMKHVLLFSPVYISGILKLCIFSQFIIKPDSVVQFFLISNCLENSARADKYILHSVTFYTTSSLTSRSGLIQGHLCHCTLYVICPSRAPGELALLTPGTHIHTDGSAGPVG